MIFQPHFKDSEVRRLKLRRIQERRQFLDDKSAVAYEVYLEELFKGSPFGASVSGSIPSLQGLSAQSLRSFYRRERRGAANKILSVVGKWDRSLEKAVFASLSQQEKREQRKSAPLCFGVTAPPTAPQGPPPAFQIDQSSTKLERTSAPSSSSVGSNPAWSQIRSTQTSAALPAGADPISSSISEVRADIRNIEIFLSQRSYHLQECRKTCLSACDGSNCSQEQCDKGACKQARADYDRVKQSLEGARQALLRLETQRINQENQSLTVKNKALRGGTQSALQHTRKAKKNMGLYIGMGVATTALLGYMSYKCCSAAFGDDFQSSGEGLPCSQLWCGVYVAGTGVAGFQTYKMIKQKKQLAKVEEALCEKDALTKACSGEEAPPEAAGGFTADYNLAGAPGCQDEPARCRATLCAIDPADSSCFKKPSSAVAKAGAAPSSIATGDGASYTPPSADFDKTALNRRLSQVYAPVGGWPKGQDPFEKHKDFDLSRLTAGQKQTVDRLLAGHNTQTKNWLNGMGVEPIEGLDPAFSLAEEEGFFEGEGFDDSLLSEEQAQSIAEGGPAGALSSFAAETAAVAPAPSHGGGDGRRQRSKKKKKGDLAKQMNAMLKKYYGFGDNTAKDPYKDQSAVVGLGQTPVGVKGDNLFLMSHRRHQNLIKAGAFIEGSTMDTDTSDSL